LKIVKLKCKKDMIIYGRNENGKPDKCFECGKEYLFCFDEKTGNIFIFNEVKEIHSLDLEDYYTDKYFDVIAIDDAENFNLDEFSLNRMKRLYKDRNKFVE
jgi:hypothetical protein